MTTGLASGEDDADDDDDDARCARDGRRWCFARVDAIVDDVFVNAARMMTRASASEAWINLEFQQQQQHKNLFATSKGEAVAFNAQRNTNTGTMEWIRRITAFVI
jgi:hypothetical protein